MFIECWSGEGKKEFFLKGTPTSLVLASTTETALAGFRFRFIIRFDGGSNDGGRFNQVLALTTETAPAGFRFIIRFDDGRFNGSNSGRRFNRVLATTTASDLAGFRFNDGGGGGGGGNDRNDNGKG